VNLKSGLRVSLRTDATLFPPAEGPGQRRRLLAHLALVEPLAEAQREARA